jgi:hypothetical protein
LLIELLSMFAPGREETDAAVFAANALCREVGPTVAMAVMAAVC